MSGIVITIGSDYFVICNNFKLYFLFSGRATKCAFRAILVALLFGIVTHSLGSYRGDLDAVAVAILASIRMLLTFTTGLQSISLSFVQFQSVISCSKCVIAHQKKKTKPYTIRKNNDNK